ncbi:hypothetical protein Bca101_067218 [Brassica carinata]
MMIGRWYRLHGVYPWCSEDRVIDGRLVYYHKLDHFVGVFATYIGSLMVPSDMVVSPAKLTRGLISGLKLFSLMSIFLNVSLKITSTVLPVSTRIRETSQSPIVNVMTRGSLCGMSSPSVSAQFNVTGICLVESFVAFFSFSLSSRS